MHVKQPNPAYTEAPPQYIRLDPWEGEYLYMIAQRARTGILEIGRYNGGSTLLLSCANDSVPIWSIDIAPQDDALARKVLDQIGVGGLTTLIIGDSQREQDPQVGDFDVLFVDGDHSHEGCLADLRNWYGRLKPGGHIVLHDGYSGSPVVDAVLEFASETPVSFLLPPYVRRAHWTHPTGSMMHLQKPAA